MKEKIRTVFNSNVDCALASIAKDGGPQVAIMGFADTEDFELVMGTSSESRKYQNIQSNPKVAVAIGWTWEKPMTVQYEGTVRLLEGEELAAYQKVYFAKQPEAKKFAKLPTQVYFVIKPRLIRYTDYTNEQDIDTFELRF